MRLRKISRIAAICMDEERSCGLKSPTKSSEETGLHDAMADVGLCQ